MILNFLESVFVVPLADLFKALQNQWRDFVVGTTTCTFTVKCPVNQKVGTLSPAIGITTLYATGAGGTLVISDGQNELQYLLTATPLQLSWPAEGPLMMERAKDVSFTITGAASGASITATGVSLR